MSDFENYLDWISENWDLFAPEEHAIIIIPEDSEVFKL